MNYSAQELFELLNQTDESLFIEAKGGQLSSHSVMETVCAYANEPGQGGGYIIMGIALDETSSLPKYKVAPVTDPDKFQRDFATQCASMFNIPVRPVLTVERIGNDTVIKIWVAELPDRQKPLYFKAEGLPGGAYRRIGSTDQRCTEDDLRIFYQDTTSYDQSPVRGASVADIDEHALKRYRVLREKVNPFAEEINFNDQELLEALGCVNKQDTSELNMAGLLLFGSSKVLRSFYPMLRVDYIRVPGNTWIQKPDERFTTIDMRGPLLLLMYRLIDAINADLPKGFLLPENNLQATSVGMPAKALREAIVNALMHRSYREHRPTQVIRYDNRVEIINPGFSLKPDDRLGLPGSETRNPFIAAVFHDTNLAETKGSGIRAMRRLMQESHLAPPTFESHRAANEFISRLLLHHFLGEDDINWLRQFDDFNLSDSQKQALVFVRELGAIDNKAFRQLSDCDPIKASSELRLLKSLKLLETKGKGKASYYVPAWSLNEYSVGLSTQGYKNITPPPGVNTQAIPSNTQADTDTTHADTHSTHAFRERRDILLEELPAMLKAKVSSIRKRENDTALLMNLIIEICSLRAFKSNELAILLHKREDYIRRKFLHFLIENKEIGYLYPEMIKHPEQAYFTIKNN